MGGKERRVGIVSICVSPKGSKKSVNFPAPSSSSHMVTFRSPIYFIKYIYIKVPFCNSVGLATNVIFGEETPTRTAGDGVSEEQTPRQRCSLASLSPQLLTGPRPTAHSTVHGADQGLSLETSTGKWKSWNCMNTSFNHNEAKLQTSGLLPKGSQRVRHDSGTREQKEAWEIQEHSAIITLF